jgi:hypothetical protein
MADYRTRVLDAFEKDEIDEEDARSLLKQHRERPGAAPGAVPTATEQPQSDLARKTWEQYVSTPVGQEVKPETIANVVRTIPQITEANIGEEARKGALRGVDTLQGSGWAGSAAINKAFGMDDAAQFAADRAIQNKFEAQQNPAAIQQTGQIVDARTLAEYLAGNVAQQGVQQLPLIALGLAGRAAAASRPVLGYLAGQALPSYAQELGITAQEGIEKRGIENLNLPGTFAAPVAGAALETLGAIPEAVGLGGGKILAKSIPGAIAEGVGRAGRAVAADIPLEAAGEAGQTYTEAAPNLAPGERLFTSERAAQAKEEGKAAALTSPLISGPVTLAGQVRPVARAAQAAQAQRIDSRAQIVQQAQQAGIPLVDERGTARSTASLATEIRARQPAPAPEVPTPPVAENRAPVAPTDGKAAPSGVTGRLGEIMAAADQGQEAGATVPEAANKSMPPAGGAATAAPPQALSLPERRTDAPERRAAIDEIAQFGVRSIDELRGMEDTKLTELRDYLLQREKAGTIQRHQGPTSKERFSVKEGETEPPPLYEQRVQSAEEQARRPEVTEDMVRQALPAAERYEAVPGDVGGGTRAHMPGDRQVWVKPTGEIFFDKARAREAGYSETAVEGGKPAASWSTDKRDALIQLTQEGIGEIDHEVFHDAMSMALDDSQRAAVQRQYGTDEEAAARSYNAWKNDPQRKPEGAWQRVKDWAQGLLDMTAGRASLGGTFRGVETGKAYREASKREGQAMPDRIPGETEEAYMVRAPVTSEQDRSEAIPADAEIDIQVYRKKTGEMVTIKANARQAYSDTMADIESLETALRNCL